jgi:hypothetical protein
MLENFRKSRVYDDDYLAWIRQQPCCLCGDNVHVEAAHLRVGSIVDGKVYTGMGQKSSDRWALPLCGRHHREQHTMNEREFWASYGINPFALAMTYRMPERE